MEMNNQNDLVAEDDEFDIRSISRGSSLDWIFRPSGLTPEHWKPEDINPHDSVDDGYVCPDYTSPTPSPKPPNSHGMSHGNGQNPTTMSPSVCKDCDSAIEHQEASLECGNCEGRMHSTCHGCDEMTFKLISIIPRNLVTILCGPCQAGLAICRCPGLGNCRPATKSKPSSTATAQPGTSGQAHNDSNLGSARVTRSRKRKAQEGKSNISTKASEPSSSKVSILSAGEMVKPNKGNATHFAKNIQRSQPKTTEGSIPFATARQLEPQPVPTIMISAEKLVSDISANVVAALTPVLRSGGESSKTTVATKRSHKTANRAPALVAPFAAPPTQPKKMKVSAPYASPYPTKPKRSSGAALSTFMQPLQDNFDEWSGNDVASPSEKQPRVYDWSKLPAEVLLRIFSNFVDETAFLHGCLALVCKTFRNITADATLLKNLQFYPHSCEHDDALAPRFEKFCAFLLSLAKNRRQPKLLSHVETLVLDFGREFYSPGSPALISIFKPLRGLQVLLVAGKTLSDNAFVPCLPKTLTHLHLIDSEWVSRDLFQPLQDLRIVPHLKCLHVNNAEHYNYAYLARRADCFESLFLDVRLGDVAKRSLVNVLANASRLKYLAISQDACSYRPLNLLGIVGQHCRSLEVLEFSDTMGNLSSRNLQELYYPNPADPGNGGIRLLSNLKRLTVDASSKLISLADIRALRGYLGPDVDITVRIEPCGSLRPYKDWKCLEKEFANVKFLCSGFAYKMVPVCVPPGATRPCTKIYGTGLTLRRRLMTS